MLQDLIFHTRLCGNSFLTYPSWLFYFYKINMIAWKYFVPLRYKLLKSISAGLAFK